MHDYPSPNVASLGLFGQIPADYFTGVPDINIPLHTIQMKEIQLPVRLKYHIGNIKPDVSPSWVGLGWILEAGGSITRIINGRKDEMTKEENSLLNNSTVTPSEHPGYYYQASKLVDSTNWNTRNFLVNYASPETSLSPVRYYSDLEPDEFIFDFAGIKGSFYYNGKKEGKDQFKVHSAQNLDISTVIIVKPNVILENNKLEVFKGMYGYYNAASPRELPLGSYFFKFIIIDQQGIRYEFGGSKDAIDFTTVPIATNANVHTSTTAVSWHLTSITTPNGDTVTFEYKKEGDYFINVKTRGRLWAGHRPDNDGGTGYNEYNFTSNSDNFLAIQHASYLKKITTSRGETVDFRSNPSNELGYNYYNGHFGEEYSTNMVLRERFNDCILFNNGNYKLKLDTLIISNETENVKNIILPIPTLPTGAYG
jgi:hypothetical protein